MKILFTGASSFTGYWFVKTLASSGHNVSCIYTADSAAKYDGTRRERVEEINKISKSIFGIHFGDEKFIQLIRNENFDLLCHHAAYVQNYKDAAFDFSTAVRVNTNNVYKVLETMTKSGCSNIVITGSVFEGGEGTGSDSLPQFSPYGLSKSLSSQIFEYYAGYFKINYGKFVIPNPFGPYEEPRFTAYLMKNWMKGEVPKVNTPDYVRDNIPVSLLAQYYKYFSEAISKNKKQKLSPSGIVCSQGIFTQLVAKEVSSRIKLKCDFILGQQTDFSEPLIRINTDRIADIVNSFSEKEFWDSFAEYYQKK